jgi:hypothetical protein
MGVLFVKFGWQWCYLKKQFASRVHVPYVSYFFPNIRVRVLVWSVIVIWLHVLELEYWSGYPPLFLPHGAGSTQQLHPAFTQFARYRLVVGSLTWCISRGNQTKHGNLKTVKNIVRRFDFKKKTLPSIVDALLWLELKFQVQIQYLLKVTKMTNITLKDKNNLFCHLVHLNSEFLIFISLKQNRLWG